LPPSASAPPGEARFTSSTDQNLAEMAQRLEAALRRPAKVEEARPQAALPVPEPVDQSKEPVTATAEVSPSSSAPPDETPPATRNEGRSQRADGKPVPAKSLYDSLEQEMASLLGRPNGKS
jgi:flagellar protein FliO/FliZ